MAIPLFVLVKAEHIATVNAVLADLQSGPQQIGAPHTSLTDRTTITHYAMLHMGADQSLVDELSALTLGILPAINGEWGANGVPTGAAAVAAAAGGNMKVVPGYGVTTPTEVAQFIAGQYAGFEVAAYDNV